MESETAHVALNIAGRPLRVSLEVPAGRMRRRELLPVFRQVADAVIAIGVQQAESEGEFVSCRKGCGACCRQLVPISEPEAHALRELVEEMPEGRRKAVRARFSDARRRLEQTGLLDRLLNAEVTADADLPAFGLEYFNAGIACPFLEHESCSIHPDRPIACREYLVTSPAAHCADPSAKTVHMVQLAGKVSSALSRTGEAATRATPWVPLVVALEWAGGREEETARPSRELVEEFFHQLTH